MRSSKYSIEKFSSYVTNEGAKTINDKLWGDFILSGHSRTY